MQTQTLYVNLNETIKELTLLLKRKDSQIKRLVAALELERGFLQDLSTQCQEQQKRINRINRLARNY